MSCSSGQAEAHPVSEGPASEGTSPPPALRVRTFNIRYGTADDGEDRWELRRSRLLRFLEESPVDLLGCQEALPEQVAELAAALPDHQVVSRGRDREGGEASPIFLRKDRFTLLESGTFWLSEHPEEVASRGWDAALPRIATWAVLRVAPGNELLCVFCTHFDHRGEEARRRSAELLVERARERAGSMPVLLLGDFNAGENSAAMQTFRAAGMRDSFRGVHPGADEVGTFHGFTGRRDGEKIDGIWLLGALSAQDAAIEHETFEGRYPSDHFPVRATIVLTGEAH